jgi:hypothetical protein
MQKVRIWEIWDWKAIRKTAFVLSVLCVALYFFFHFPDFVRKNAHGSRLNSVAFGNFLSSEKITERSQGITGSATTVIAYAIRYTYTVDGTVFFGQDKIPISSENDPFFSKLKTDLNRILTINYNLADPRESQIDTQK